MRRLIVTAAALAALGVGLAGCETPTPYQPLAVNAPQAGGYSEVKLEDDRWRVTFQGNGSTPRATVETYLLHRAAELTVNNGFDWFEAVQRQTDKHTQTFVDPMGPIGPYGYGFGWRYYHHGGWGGWGGWGDPFLNDDIDVQTIERYEASSEIVMHHGPRPANDPHAYDARQLLNNLAGAKPPPV